jgi:hypothetical protein
MKSPSLEGVKEYFSQKHLRVIRKFPPLERGLGGVSWRIKILGYNLPPSTLLIVT